MAEDLKKLLSDSVELLTKLQDAAKGEEHSAEQNRGRTANEGTSYASGHGHLLPGPQGGIGCLCKETP